MRTCVAQQFLWWFGRAYFGLQQSNCYSREQLVGFFGPSPVSFEFSCPSHAFWKHAKHCKAKRLRDDLRMSTCLWCIDSIWLSVSLHSLFLALGHSDCFETATGSINHYLHGPTHLDWPGSHFQLRLEGFCQLVDVSWNSKKPLSLRSKLLPHHTISAMDASGWKCDAVIRLQLHKKRENASMHSAKHIMIGFSTYQFWREPLSKSPTPSCQEQFFVLILLFFAES